MANDVTVVAVVVAAIVPVAAARLQRVGAVWGDAPAGLRLEVKRQSRQLLQGGGNCPAVAAANGVQDLQNSMPMSLRI